MSVTAEAFLEDAAQAKADEQASETGGDESMQRARQLLVDWHGYTRYIAGCNCDVCYDNYVRAVVVRIMRASAWGFSDCYTVIGRPQSQPLPIPPPAAERPNPSQLEAVPMPTPVQTVDPKAEERRQLAERQRLDAEARERAKIVGSPLAPPAIPDGMITLFEASQRYGIGQGILKQAADSHRLPHRRTPSERYYFRPEDIESRLSSYGTAVFVPRPKRPVWPLAEVPDPVEPSTINQQLDAEIRAYQAQEGKQFLDGDPAAAKRQQAEANRLREAAQKVVAERAAAERRAQEQAARDAEKQRQREEAERQRAQQEAAEAALLAEFERQEAERQERERVAAERLHRQLDEEIERRRQIEAAEKERKRQEAEAQRVNRQRQATVKQQRQLAERAKREREAATRIEAARLAEQERLAMEADPLETPTKSQLLILRELDQHPTRRVTSPGRAVDKLQAQLLRAAHPVSFVDLACDIDNLVKSGWLYAVSTHEGVATTAATRVREIGLTDRGVVEFKQLKNRN